jgi:hypothetical protein
LSTAQGTLKGAKIVDYTYELRRILQPVEKVGVELMATKDRAWKGTKTGVSGSQSGAKASTKGVFQQAGGFS